MPFSICAKPQSAVNSNAELFHLSQQDRTFQQKPYRLFIALPKQQNNGSVLYLLDGNAHFAAALQALDPNLPLPAIVAIGYPTEQRYAVAERTRDYTFAAAGDQFAAGGGAADFLDFVAELPNWLEKQYALQPQYKLFFGHSFGGLFGLYVWLNRPELFDDYTIASPSLWWGNGTILQQRSVPFERLPAASLLFTLGEYEANPHADPDSDPARIQRVIKRRCVLKVEDFQQQLAQHNIVSEFHLMAKTNHGNSAIPALKMAVQKAQQPKK
ncbi:alpha/beta hydrolase [Testudinibacter sp. P27/CKL/0425]